MRLSCNLIILQVVQTGLEGGGVSQHIPAACWKSADFLADSALIWLSF